MLPSVVKKKKKMIKSAVFLCIKQTARTVNYCGKTTQTGASLTTTKNKKQTSDYRKAIVHNFDRSFTTQDLYSVREFVPSVDKRLPVLNKKTNQNTTRFA